VVDLVNRLESEARAGRQGRLADYLLWRGRPPVGWLSITRRLRRLQISTNSATPPGSSWTPMCPSSPTAGPIPRQITGTFGTETISVPRARVEDEAGKVSEWRSKALPRYQRLTKTAER
jgi:hypothetical protein